MENYLLIEDILSIKSEFNNPLVELSIKSQADIEKAAQCLRDKWNIGTDPISNIISLLEDKGIKVVEIDEDESHSFDGLSTFVNDKFPAVVINKNFTIERKRFTLFHELGHLLLNFSSSISEKEEEKLCNQFAGAILLPGKVLYEEIGKQRKNLSIQELINLQKRYGISIPAIMYRLASLGIISELKMKGFYIKVNRDPGFKVEVYEERYLGEERSDRYKLLVYRAYTQEIISASKASSLLDIDVQSIKKQITLV